MLPNWLRRLFPQKAQATPRRRHAPFRAGRSQVLTLEDLEGRLLLSGTPVVSSETPNFGPFGGGTVAVLHGTSFTGATQVLFGGTAAPFEVVSDTQIIATTPARTPTTWDTVVDVQVGTATSLSTAIPADHFTYLGDASQPLPVVQGVSPNSGPNSGGTVVTLTGVNFTGTKAVTFGNTPASSFTVLDDTHIQATAPVHAGGTVNVKVTNLFSSSGDKTASHFTYLLAPTVTAVYPPQGVVGTTVYITGTSFTPTTTVTFGGTFFVPTFLSSQELQVAAPNGTWGSTASVQVSNGYGYSNLGVFTYSYPSSSTVPTVTAISAPVWPWQAAGPLAGGTIATITGTNFTNATTVLFGGVPATFSINSPTQITATAPAAGTPGTVHVQVVTPSAISATTPTNPHDQFYYAGLPVITGISANTGPTTTGTTVTVSGYQLANVEQVLFNNVPWTGGSYTANYPDSTSITVNVPAASMPGLVDVQVITDGGTSALTPADHFTYYTPGSTVVSGISLNSGPTLGGNVVTITGANFTGARSVAFGNTPATSFTVNSATQITATAPPGLAAGPVDVRVTSATGVASPVTIADQYTYVAPPTVTLVNNGNPIIGGSVVTIMGYNFTGVRAVMFGNLPVPNFTVVSDNQITATAPSQVTNPVDVQVNNLYNTSDSTTNSLYPATHYLIYTPASSTTNTPVSITALALNQYNDLVSGYIGTIHFTSSDSQAVLPVDYTFTAADGGVHTFMATLRTVGPQTVTATDRTAGITGTTHVTVTPGPANHFVMTAPTGGTAGTAFSVTVTALDANNNIATGYGGTVHFTSSDSTATLPSDYTFTAADRGVHTFSVTLKTAGPQTVTAADRVTTSLTAIVHLTITPGPVNHFMVTAPAGGTAGTAFSVTVTALDANNNIATGYGGTVHFTSSDSTATLPTDYPFTAADGCVHTFSVTLRAAGVQSVTATDRVAAGITGTTQVTVTPVRFWLNAPTGSTAGTAFTVTVTALDANNHVAAGYADTVQFSSSDSAAGLPSDYTFRAADRGVHTFSVTLKTAGPQTVTATDRMTAAIMGTAQVTVTPAAASHLLVTAPTSGTAGAAFPVTVTALDAYNNVATGYGGTVHFTSSDSTATLPTDYPFTAADQGVHTFTVTLILSGSQTITATDRATNSITGVATLTVNVLPPVVTGMSPTWSAPAGGTVVTITGTNLYDVSLSTFGMLTPSSFTVNSSGTQITFIAPPGHGQDDNPFGIDINYPFISVVNSAGSSFAGHFCYSANAAFVDEVYHDLLHRPADPSGLQNWTNQLYQGASRNQVVQAILGSNEYVTDLVSGWYSTYLQRTAGPADLNIFVPVLQNRTMTNEQVQTAILSSPEYYARRANGSDQGFLSALYLDVLGRSAGAADFAAWGASSGSAWSDADRGNVVAAVLQSPEYRNDLIEGYYQTYLGRLANSTELGLWSGVSDEAIIAAILSSDELFSRLL